MIYIKEVNSAFIKVTSPEAHIEQELYDYFMIQQPPQWLVIKKKDGTRKKKLTNGKTVLYKKQTKLLYRGLLNYVRKFAEERNYPITYQSDFSYNNVSEEELRDFIKLLKLPLEVRDYQFDAILTAVRQRRKTILSPTSSGKSLIIYVIIMFCMYKGWVKKPLIIAPTINLVIQMKGDFISYGCDPKLVHVIHYGHEKYSAAPIFVSTWQSIVDYGIDYFNQFDMFIGDEAHGFEAKSLVSIATRMVNCHYKLGFTGTLKDTVTHRLIIEGLFGDQMRTITTKEMIDQGYASKFKINIVVLNYPQRYREKMDYQEELDFLLNYEPRQKFIKHLATQVKGSTLVLFQFVRKHGVELFNRIAEIDPEHTHFVYGGVPGDDREKIRKIIMDSKVDEKVVASMGTFSTGVNIPRLRNAIFANPTNKSKIKTLQSIGRTLRLHEEKDVAVLYDVVDNLSYDGNLNYSLTHLQKRIEMYDAEQFPYEIFKVDLKEV